MGLNKTKLKMSNARNFPLFHKLYKLNPFEGIPIFISFYDLLLKVNVYFYSWTYYYKIVYYLQFKQDVCSKLKL